MFCTQPASRDFTLTFKPRNSIGYMSRLCFFHLTNHVKSFYISHFLSGSSSTMAHGGWDATVAQICHLQGIPQAPFFKCYSARMGSVATRKDSRCSGSSTVSPAPVSVIRFVVAIWPRIASFPVLYLGTMPSANDGTWGIIGFWVLESRFRHRWLLQS